MRIAVVGAGGVGGYFGGMLARRGADVSLIVRGANYRAIAANGLSLSTSRGDFTVRLPAAPDPADIGAVDLVLYCVKTYHNREAIPMLAPLLGPGAAILTLQNGVDSGGQLARAYGWRRVLPGAAYVESALAGPGRVEQTGATARIVFGERDGERTERVVDIASTLKTEGIQVEVSDDITTTLWTKLMMVAAAGTTMAAARASLPEIFDSPTGREVLATLMEEIRAVGLRKGARFAPGIVKDHLEALEAEADAYKASLKLDLEAGRPLELDDVIGAAVREGRKTGVPVPACAALYTALYRFRNGTRT